MIGSIHFEKIWEDGELIEIALVIDSEHITANHNYYTTKTKISSLQEHLKAFTECRDTRFDWISADGVTSEVPRFSLICTHMDNKGHVKVEITMDIDDCGEMAAYHKCSFNVFSELGLLSQLTVN